jgi:Tetrapyrrole (Corrin/Porphyrin) Methylases
MPQSINQMTGRTTISSLHTSTLFVVMLLSPLVVFSDAYQSANTHSFINRRNRQHRQQIYGRHLVKPESSNEWGIPNSDDLPALVQYVTKPVPKMLANGGRVTLVGSGPGDPDLLTITAYKLLTNTDSNTIVIVDRLVSQEILKLIKCDYKVARKLPGCAELAQEEIYWWAYQALNQGKHVIRLKIGDPFVFGRGGEEVLCFRRFGVDPVVVPVRYPLVLPLYI